MDPRRHKPARIRLKPGERWLSADRSESAIITMISSTLLWRHEEEIWVHFLWQSGDQTAAARLLLAEFTKRFPVREDIPIG